MARAACQRHANGQTRKAPGCPGARGGVRGGCRTAPAPSNATRQAQTADTSVAGKNVLLKPASLHPRIPVRRGQETRRQNHFFYSFKNDWRKVSIENLSRGPLGTYLTDLILSSYQAFGSHQVTPPPPWGQRETGTFPAEQILAKLQI